MKYSVAIFGHYKPEYYIIRNEPWIQQIPYGVWVGPKNDRQHEMRTQEIQHDKKVVASVLADEFVEYEDHFRSGDYVFEKPLHYLHQCVGREKRAVPGDVVACKSTNDWTPTEQKEFLIVDVDGLESNQLGGFTEVEYDLGSYETYDPLSFEAWYSMRQVKNLSKANPEKADRLLEENKDKWYQEYLKGMQERCSMPRRHWKKRRLNIPLNTLETAGCDTTIMLNKGIEYAPKLRIFYPDEFYDKLKQRNIVQSDNLEPQKPRTLEEMQDPKSEEEILKELRA